VRFQARLVGPLANLLYLGLRLYFATPSVVGVFQTKQPGLNHVLVQGSDRPEDIRQTEYPLLTGDGLGNESA